MRPLVGSHRRLGGVHWAVGWGSPEKKLDAGGGRGARGMASATVDQRWGVVSGEGGPAAGGGGWRFGRWWLAAEGGWSLMINWRPLISYPMAGKSNDQR